MISTIYLKVKDSLKQEFPKIHTDRNENESDKVRKSNKKNSGRKQIVKQNQDDVPTLANDSVISEKCNSSQKCNNKKKSLIQRSKDVDNESQCKIKDSETSQELFKGIENNNRVPKKEGQHKRKKSVVQNAYDIFRKSLPFPKLHKYPMKRSFSTGFLPKQERNDSRNYSSLKKINVHSSSTSNTPLFCRKLYLTGMLPSDPSDMNKDDCRVIKVNAKIFEHCSNPILVHTKMFNIEETSMKSEAIPHVTNKQKKQRSKRSRTRKMSPPIMTAEDAHSDHSAVSNYNNVIKTPSENQQAPQLPALYSNFSPRSHRKAMNPASIAREVTAPNPVPLHFNRPSPNSSPILVRRNRNPSPSKPFLKPHKILSSMDTKIKPSDNNGLNPSKGQQIHQPQKVDGRSTSHHDVTSHKVVDQIVGKNVSSLGKNTMPMQCTESSGHTAKSKCIVETTSSVSDASCVQSVFSSTSLVETSSTVVQYRSKTQSGVNTSQSHIEEKSHPWRVATNASSSVSGDSDGANRVASSQVPWRAAREQPISNSNNSTVSASAVSHTNTANTNNNSAFDMNLVKQVQIGIQQQSQPLLQDAPWRSPKVKRREIVKPASVLTNNQSSPPVKVLPTNNKTESIKQIPVNSISNTPSSDQISSTVVTSKASDAVTMSASVKSSSTSNIKISNIKNESQVQKQASIMNDIKQQEINRNLSMNNQSHAIIKTPPINIKADSIKQTPTESTPIKSSPASQVTSSLVGSTRMVKSSSEDTTITKLITASTTQNIKSSDRKIENQVQKQISATDIQDTKQKDINTILSRSTEQTYAKSVSSDSKHEDVSIVPSEKVIKTIVQMTDVKKEEEIQVLGEVSTPQIKDSEVQENANKQQQRNEQTNMENLAENSLSHEESVEDHLFIPPPPPPPSLMKKKIESHADTSSEGFTLPFQLQNLGFEDENPEYTRVPVTSRIQRFEKQSSFEHEKKEKPNLAPARPVGPWIKKTSTGHVQHDVWDAVEGSWMPDNAGLDDSKVMQVKQQTSATTSNISSNVQKIVSKPQREKPNIPLAPSVAPSVAPLDSSDVTSQPPKQIQNLMMKSRTKGTAGDYEHSYIDHDDKHTHAAVGTPARVCPIKSEKIKPYLFDPWCDPNNPVVVQFQDVSAAAFKIKSGILNTPCTRSNISSLVHSEVFFKKEFNQYTGSFKERGARYTLLCLPEEDKKNGVIAASAGNHALALSYHGQELGISVTVVMPLVAPIMKVQACRQYGANILVKGKDIGECREIALQMAKEQGLTYINGYDHPHILAGQGTMGLEIVEQVPNIDAVVVPIGGGGLIAGVALAVKSLYPHIKVIGVESEKCKSFNGAMEAGKPIHVNAESSLADGLSVPIVGVNAFATAHNLIDKIVSVPEEWIAIAILRLVEIEKAVVEGAGAAALAALLAGKLPELVGKRVVIPLCGGNIDTTVLGRCLERGLAADGRLVKFTVTVTDRPGGMADLTRLLANLGVSIKDMLHERAWIKSDIFSVEVKCVCETRDYQHMLELKSALEMRYPNMRFPLPKHIDSPFDHI